MKATMLKESDDFFVCGFDRFFFTIWNGLGMYGITVVVKEDKQIIVSIGGWNNESAGLIRSDVSSDGATVGINGVGTLLGLGNG